jgi:hypothetical protein
MFIRSAFQYILSFAAVSSDVGRNLTALYGPSLSPGARIVLSTDVNYTQTITQRWTVYGAPKYLGAIQPATEDDIKNVVRIALLRELRLVLEKWN